MTYGLSFPGKHEAIRRAIVETSWGPHPDTCGDPGGREGRAHQMLFAVRARLVPNRHAMSSFSFALPRGRLPVFAVSSVVFLFLTSVYLTSSPSGLFAAGLPWKEADLLTPTLSSSLGGPTDMFDDQGIFKHDTRATRYVAGIPGWCTYFPYLCAPGLCRLGSQSGRHSRPPLTTSSSVVREPVRHRRRIR